MRKIMEQHGTLDKKKASNLHRLPAFFGTLGNCFWCLGRESNPYGLRRGIFVTLRLSPPAIAVRALDYAFTVALRAVGAPV